MKRNSLSFVVRTLLLASLAAVLLVACGDDSSTTTPNNNNPGGGGVAANGNAGVPGGSGVGGVTPTAGTGGTTPTAGTGGTTPTAGTGGTTPTAGADGAGTSGGGGTGVPKDGQCKATAEGVYAMKTVLDVWWQDDKNGDLPLVDSGRGQIVIYLRGELTDIDDVNLVGKGVIHPCGVELPIFLVDANCSAIQLDIPNEAWESASMPDFVTTGSTTGFNPGDTLSIAVTTALLGLDITDPNVFPGSINDVTCAACPGGGACVADCFPDADGDGNPGLTVKMANINTQVSNPTYPCGAGIPFTYKAAPLSVVGGALAADNDSADAAYVGLRNVLGGSGLINDDCASGVGKGNAAVDAILNRIAACHRPDGAECTVAQSDFLDLNTPVYHVLQEGEIPPATWQHQREKLFGLNLLNRDPSKGPQSSVIRLGDPGAAITCEQIRNAAYPALP